MRTTVSLPEPLVARAKKHAARRGVTLSKVIEDALRRHLSEPAWFRLRTVGGRLVQPELDLDRTSALIVQDDEISHARRQR